MSIWREGVWAIFVLTGVACGASSGGVADSGAPADGDSGSMDDAAAAHDGGADASSADAWASDGATTPNADASARLPSEVYGANCADTLPAGGTSCPQNGAACTYGDTTSGDCRDKATCSGTTWTVTKATCPLPAPADQCPSQPGGDAGATCSGTTFCRYANGYDCECMGSLWGCASPTPQGPTCPTVPPNEGTLCDTGQTCSYPCQNLSANHVTATCSAGGTWAWALATCSGND